MAGADPLTAARLGASMAALQGSIGALNDLVDAPVDRDTKPSKPIASGLVSPRTAAFAVVIGAMLGLGLAVPSGPMLIALAGVVLAIGYGYDLVAKGSAWSWLPLAVGIPLLPVYGWLGTTASLPQWFVAFLPMTAVAGAAIAVANARADLEGDDAAGTRTVATVLGPDRSWGVLVMLWGMTAVIALVSLMVARAEPLEVALVGGGVTAIFLGVLLGWRSSPRRREWSWEVQAIGAAIAAIGWLLTVV